MDIWERLYQTAKGQYLPREVSPFIYAHHVVCALESENGQIFTGRLANQLLLVLYTATTRSLPPQTTPDEVVVFCPVS